MVFRSTFSTRRRAYRRDPAKAPQPHAAELPRAAAGALAALPLCGGSAGARAALLDAIANLFKVAPINALSSCALPGGGPGGSGGGKGGGGRPGRPRVRLVEAAVPRLLAYCAAAAEPDWRVRRGAAAALRCVATRFALAGRGVPGAAAVVPQVAEGLHRCRFDKVRGVRDAVVAAMGAFARGGGGGGGGASEQYRRAHPKSPPPAVKVATGGLTPGPEEPHVRRRGRGALNRTRRSRSPGDDDGDEPRSPRSKHAVLDEEYSSDDDAS